MASFDTGPIGPWSYCRAPSAGLTVSPKEGQSSLIVSTFREIFGLTEAIFFFFLVLYVAVFALFSFVCVTMYVEQSVVCIYRLLDHMIITWLLNNYFAPFLCYNILSP